MEEAPEQKKIYRIAFNCFIHWRRIVDAPNIFKINVEESISNSAHKKLITIKNYFKMVINIQKILQNISIFKKG